MVRIIARRAITRKERETELKPKIFLITIPAAALISLPRGTPAGSSGSNAEKTGASVVQKSNPIADENQMNSQPRGKVQQGGKMTWAIESTIVNFNANQLDGTTGRRQLGNFSHDAWDVCLRCARNAKLRSGLPHRRTGTHARSSAGREVQAEPKGALVGR